MRWKHEPGPVRSEGGFWAKWVEGYRYVSGFLPARAMLLLLGVLSWTISPYSSLMPFYAKDVYGGSPQVLGFLLAAAGAGALASTIYLASRVTIRGLGRVIALAGVGSGVALAAFGYLAFLPGALALMFVVGGGTVLAAASVNTILHSIVPDALRGRVAGFLHAGVSRHGAARQSRGGSVGKRDRCSGDVRAERRGSRSRGALVLASAPQMATVDPADLRAFGHHRKRIVTSRRHNQEPAE
jgi:hypothetical protein